MESKVTEAMLDAGMKAFGETEIVGQHFTRRALAEAYLAMSAAAARSDCEPDADAEFLLMLADDLSLPLGNDCRFELRCIAERIASRLKPDGELRYWERPFGDAGDAIDFALDHISPMPKMRWFLEDWRSAGEGSNFPDEWPEYKRWLKVQQDGAKAALSEKTP